MGPRAVPACDYDDGQQRPQPKEIVRGENLGDRSAHTMRKCINRCSDRVRVSPSVPQPGFSVVLQSWRRRAKVQPGLNRRLCVINLVPNVKRPGLEVTPRGVERYGVPAEPDDAIEEPTHQRGSASREAVALGLCGRDTARSASHEACIVQYRAAAVAGVVAMDPLLPLFLGLWRLSRRYVLGWFLERGQCLKQPQPLLGLGFQGPGRMLGSPVRLLADFGAQLLDGSDNREARGQSPARRMRPKAGGGEGWTRRNQRG